MTPLQQIIQRLEAIENKSDFETSKNLLQWMKDLRSEEMEMCRNYFTAGFMYSRQGWNGEEPFAGKDNETIFQNIMDGYFDFAAKIG